MSSSRRTLRIGLIVGAGAVLFTSIAGIFTGCGTSDEDSTQNTQSTFETVAKYDYSKINPSDYITVPDYTDKSLVTEKPAEVTDADIDAELTSNLSYYPVYEKITDRKITDKDAVNIDYTAESSKSIIASGTGSRIDISEGESLQDVADSLVGHVPGDKYTLSVTFPEDYEGTYTDSEGKEQDLAGIKAEFSITVNYVYGDEKSIDALADDDIKDMTNGTYETISDFRDFLKQQLILTRETEVLESVWNSLIEQCSVQKDKEDEYGKLVDYEYDYELSYYEQMAESYGTDMDTLAVNYGYDNEDAFKESIRTDCEEIVRHYLIAYQIAEKEGIVLDDDTLVEEEEKVLTGYGVSSTEELESLYGATEVKLYLQLQKVDEFLKETLGIGIEKE